MVPVTIFLIHYLMLQLRNIIKQEGKDNMKSRKKGILFTIVDIVCLVMWLFIDRNWEIIAVGCVKIALLIVVLFCGAELGTCPYCGKVGIPIFQLRKKYTYCSKCGKRITFY